MTDTSLPMGLVRLTVGRAVQALGGGAWESIEKAHPGASESEGMDMDRVHSTQVVMENQKK